MKKWSKAFAIIIILILFFVPTIIALKYVTISMLYSHFVNSVSNLTGINKYLVKATAALMFIPFLIGISFLFSMNRGRRQIGKAILVTLVIIYNLSLFYFTKDLSFAFSEGKVLKWYALTPEGVKYFDRSGVDPVYGITLKPVTQDVIRNLKLLEKGEFRPVDPNNVQFFNPITGEAQVWYFRYPDGIFEFFDKPGYHPITGEPLKPVSKDIYFEWKEKSTKGKQDKRIANNQEESRQLRKHGESQLVARLSRLQEFKSSVNPSAFVSSAQKNVALVIQAPKTKVSFFPDRSLANMLRSKEVNLIKDCFTESFKTKGFFREIFDGNSTLLNQSNVLSKVNYVILGNLDYSFRNDSQIDKDLISSDINFSYKVLNNKGEIVDSDFVSVIGPGFTNDSALKRGLEIIAENHSKQIMNSIQ
jgi:hypothetical protein